MMDVGYSCRRIVLMMVLRGFMRWGLVLALLACAPSGVWSAEGQSPTSARLLVLLRDASALAIVDPVEGTVLGQVGTVGDPHEVTASDDGKLAFVASPTEGISVIDLDAQAELRRLEIGPGSEPHDVRFVDGKLYFTAEGYKVIGRYDPQRDEVEWLLGIGQDGIHMFVFSEDRDTIFTANRESDTVTVVEDVVAGPPGWSVTSIPVGGDFPEGIDLSPDGRELWTATRNDGGISIIDVAGKDVVSRLDLDMQDASRLQFTPDGERVLIADAQADSLIVLDAATRRETARLELAPDAVLVHPDGRVAYAALRGNDSVAVIDLDTLEVMSQISMGPGSGPGCMFWVPAS